MIEACAKLIGGPVYLPGERVGCCVTFTNPPLPVDKRSQSNTDTLESLAWASAQIHCLCTTSGKLSTLVNDNSTSSEKTHAAMSNTSFAPCRGDNGKIILSTKPKILFCDLRLSPGESKSYLYSEVLPSDCPPSYKGQLVKYSYKITVGTQRVNCATKLLRVPIRVLVINGLTENTNMCEDSVDLSPSNPFLESKEKENELGTSLQVLQNITARRSLNYFNITNARGKVTRFCLFKHAYKLGEDIVGTLDFTSASVPCVQFTVTLQCEEQIPGREEKAIMSFNNFHEFCLNMKQCFLNLPIPLHVTPAFTTPLVSLRWRLHFEFVTSIDDPSTLSDPNGNDYLWKGPNQLNIETMVWDLPVQLYPALPTTDYLDDNKYSIEV